MLKPSSAFREHPLLYISFGVLLFFSGFVFFDTEGFYHTIEVASVWVRNWFGTFYLYLGLFCILFILGVALSPLGRRKLGGQNTKPEFSRWAWIAMLYSAGMGAGILLRAVQEPVFMQRNPPIQSGATPEIIALEYTFYQWGFTAWAFYGLFAMVIGYYLFTRKQPALTSVAIEGITKHRIAKGSVDVLAILTTVFGLMGALGLGTTQITGGLSHIFETDFGVPSIVFLVVLISLLAFISVWRGMHKGIKLLSTLNISITLLILLFVMVHSNLGLVVKQFGLALYHYVKDLFHLSLALGNYDPGEAFLTDWTYYYWAFWIAWAPFTGIFIARISRGRTFREILMGVLLIPSLGTFIWFSVFGVHAMELIESWGSYNNEFGNVFSSIFVFFEQLPFSSVVNVITILLLIGFLVTSVDSAVFVLSMFTDKGRSTPAKRHRLIWSVGIAVFSIALVLLGNVRPETNVLIALQKLVIVTSLPFALLMVVMAVLFLTTVSKRNHKKESLNSSMQ